MEKRQLGTSDLMITRLGVGAWAMGGGGWTFSWGPQDDEASIAAIHAALDAGMNWIDTAAVYGLGHSEEVVARALDGMSERPYVFTKCSRCWDQRGEIYGCLKRDSIRAELEASLRRLKMEEVDLYQIHRPAPDEDIEVAWETLLQLKAEGKTRWIGVSNFSVEQMRRIAPLGAIDSLQPPYNLLAREIEQEILPYCADNSIGILAYSPMHSGLLSGRMTAERIAALAPDDHRRNRAQFQPPLLERNLRLAALLGEIGAPHGRSAGETAIAWTLRRPEVTAAIVGVRSAEQVLGVIGAADFRLTEDEVARLQAALVQTA
jgi:aryl-alcohol dehydrogenase-like predicted oxidoreductase